MLKLKNLIERKVCFTEDAQIIEWINERFPISEEPEDEVVDWIGDMSRYVSKDIQGVVKKSSVLKQTEFAKVMQNLIKKYENASGKSIPSDAQNNIIKYLSTELGLS